MLSGRLNSLLLSTLRPGFPLRLDKINSSKPSVALALFNLRLFRPAWLSKKLEHHETHAAPTGDECETIFLCRASLPACDLGGIYSMGCGLLRWREPCVCDIILHTES